METQAVKDVSATIERFREAVQKRDIRALELAAGHDADMVFYGSQAGDKQVGWPAIKASFEEQFRETSGIDSEVLDSSIKVNGDTAWAAYDLKYTEKGGGAAGSFESRWTCVLCRFKNGWKVVQMHHSRGR